MSIHLSMPSDLAGVAQQETLSSEDLYTPKYTRFSGAQKEGFCDLCSPGKWLKMKNSTFWYHKQFFHGISHKTCTWFDSPSETRMNRDVPEGKCHKCMEWIPLLKQKRKNGNINWFHHAAACHFRDDKRKRYDTEELLTELKRRKDDLTEDEYDLASLQPASYPQSAMPIHNSQSQTTLKSPTSASGTPTSPNAIPRKSPQLPILKPDTVRPRPPGRIDVSGLHNPYIANHGSPSSQHISPNALHAMSPQERQNHESLLQLQLHHMQQIQQIQMMLYSPSGNSGHSSPHNASPQQMSSVQQATPQQVSPQSYMAVDSASQPTLPSRSQLPSHLQLPHKPVPPQRLVAEAPKYPNLPALQKKIQETAPNVNHNPNNPDDFYFA
eukprot:NODE_642_length_5062_cov_1.602861.p2 type:complete len:382 gc:universal NODE_642_length_5062_cov_1.602861:3409-4554(+)